MCSWRLLPKEEVKWLHVGQLRGQPKQTYSKETKNIEVIGNLGESIFGRVVGNQITEYGRQNNSLPKYPCPKFQNL